MVELPEGIHIVRFPMPSSFVGGVNGFLIEGSDGWGLIDCGWDIPESLEVLREELRRHGMDLDAITTIVATHSHPDHFGLAGTLVKLVKPRVLVHRLDWDFARGHMMEGAPSLGGVAWLDLHGLSPEGWTDREKKMVNSYRPAALAVPDRQLEDGDVIQVAGRPMKVIWTPGHTVGHICLHDPEQRTLFAGDHVLDGQTPAVLTWEWLEGDPLGSNLDSLRKVADLNVDVVLPGHGEPFTGLRKRAEELIAHHRQREVVVLDVLSRCSPATAGDVAASIPWTLKNLSLTDMPVMRRRAALAQTLAHLEKLRAEGRVSRSQRDGRVYFELATNGNSRAARAGTES